MIHSLLSKTNTTSLTHDQVGSNLNDTAIVSNHQNASTLDEMDTEMDSGLADTQASELPMTSPGTSVKIKTLLYNVTVEDCQARFECDYYKAFCHCHPTCLLYNDCCYDYLVKIFTGAANGMQMDMTDYLTNKSARFQSMVSDKEAAREQFIFQHSDCIYDENNSDAYWMVNRCPNSFKEAHISQKCENGQYYGLDSLPVEWTDSEGRIWLFRNVFCAFCHGISLEEHELVVWRVVIRCLNRGDDNIVPAGAVNLYEIPSGCSVELRTPQKISDVYQRKCDFKAKETTTCQSSDYQSLCNSYIYYVKRVGKSFRNPHCAMCESELTDYYATCTEMGKIEGAGFAVDLKVMFDFDPDTGFAVKVSCHAHTNCLSFEVYDCLGSQCRPLFCRHGQVPYFGKCIDSNATAVNDVWYEARIPNDSENDDENMLFVQIEVISTNPYPVESFTDWLQILDFVEKVDDIFIEESVIKQDNNEVKDGEEPGLPENEATWNKEETTESNTNARREGERVNNFGVGNTEQNRTGTENGMNNENTDLAGDFGGNAPIVATGLLNADDMNNMNEDEFISNNKETIPNGDAWSKADNNTGGSVSDISDREFTRGGNSDTKNDEGNDNERSEMPQVDKRGVHFHYLYHAKLIIETTSVISAKEVIDKFESLQMMVDADFKVTTRSFSDLENLSCDRGNLAVIFKASYNRNMTEVTLPTFGNALINDTKWALSDESSAKEMFEMTIVCLSKYEIPVMNCNMTFYKHEEVYFENGTMHVRNGKVSFGKTEYIVVGKRIFVCIDKLVKPSYVRFFEYSSLQKYLSIITSAFSLICLLAICLMHIIFSKLRNNHGLNISALSLTMLLVQALLLVQEVPGGTACLIYAVVLHFLVLKMFVWMNIIGYDMTITFYSKTVTNNNTNYVRFIKYCIVAIFLALIFVGTGLLLDEYNSSYGPAYRKGDICWLTNSDAIIILFIAPISGSISINVLMFAIILYSIQSAKIKSAVRTNARNRTYTLVYFKLSLILGFTWIVGVIAAFVSVGWLWYIHIALNGLQGLSLFLCSIVNARTVRVLREKTQTITFSNTRSSKLNNSN